jgi:hypothetical protein
MRLFLFSASVFYLLGLKLISNLDIKPFFHQKSVSTEISAPASKITANPAVNKPKIQVKNDSIVVQKPTIGKTDKITSVKSPK